MRLITQGEARGVTFPNRRSAGRGEDLIRAPKVMACTRRAPVRSWLGAEINLPDLYYLAGDLGLGGNGSVQNCDEAGQA
jgi:hypothetical protein